ncbi:MAG: GNAT family N-acetyltransferase [Plesiomonas shigelloides]
MLEDDSPEFAEAIKAEIIAFNARHWDVTKRLPLGVKSLAGNGALRGGVSGRTFGNWCMIDYLWVANEARGQGIGKMLLLRAEHIARRRGCQRVLLDTLSFQAPGFYTRLGYREVWQQQDYPFDGQARIYLVKTLDKSEGV